ncbi:MAG: hypothetical protein AAF495_11635 [Pseudomonadota bacterium]
MERDQRKRLWTPQSASAYWKEKHDQELEAVAKRDGKDVARKIDEVLASLSGDEREVLELLLLKRMASVIALYETSVLGRLQEKGLLQPRLGVGTILMQNMETCFSVPRAVWAELEARRDRFVDKDASEDILEARISALVAKFENALQPVDIEQMPPVTQT